MKLITIALVAAMSLAACATTGSGGNGAAASVGTTGGAKQYCREGSLATAGGRHNCTWSTDKAAACANTRFTSIEASGYTSPRTSSQCDNGRWLVEMSPLG